MRIKEIELINFRQHRSTKVALSGNLIGIVGPNGSGKSNFLNGIQFGLVGEVPDVTKDKLLTWGASDGYVDLIMDNDVRIHRSVSSTSADLVNDSKRISGTTNVNNAIKALFGLDKELAKQAVFVRQAEIDSILFETPAKREQAFQKLCGMGMASTIYKRVGEVIFTRFKDPPNYDDQIAVICQKLSDEEAKLAALLKEQEDNKLPVTEQELTAMKLSLNEYVILLGNVKAAISLTQTIETASVSAGKTKSDLERIKGESAGIDLEKLRENINGARQVLADVKKYQEAKTAYEQRKADYERCGEQPVGDNELKELETKYNDLLQSYHKAQANYTMLKDIYTAIFRSGGLIADCPICGSLIRNPEQVKKDLEARMKEQSVTGYPKGLEADIKTKRAAVDVFQKTVTRARALFEQATSALASLEPLDIDVKLLEQEVASMEQAFTLGQKTLLSLRELETRLSINEDTIRNSTEQFNKTMESINNNQFAQECKTTSLTELLECIGHKHTETSTYIDAVHKLAQENSRRDGTIDVLKNVVADLKKTLEQLHEKREGVKNFTQVAKTLTGVRDWFHYSNGPRTLSTSIIKDMLANINDFLSKLEAPFSVVPQTDEGLAFRCIFHDGRTSGTSTVPEAEDLSGGEKILLATSFRLASYCMFANQLGLLSLDEPTVYLDDKNVMRFCAFLEKVKEVASALGLQIFMATHERSVIPYMDTIIDLQ